MPDENTNKIIRVGNSIVDSKYRLSEIENRLVFHLIGKIKREDSHFYEYKYSINELLKALNMPIGGHSADLLRDALLDVFKKVILIENGRDRWAAYHWFDEIKYDPIDGFRIRFSDSLAPMLIDLRERFTKLGLDSMMTLSVHARRIYMKAKQQAERVKQGFQPDQRTKDYSIDRLREEMMLGKSYKEFKWFRQKIIDPAVQEINEKSDIRISVTPSDTTKIGRKYQHITITYLGDAPTGELAPIVSAKSKPAKTTPAYMTPTKENLETVVKQVQEIEKKIRDYSEKKFERLAWTGEWGDRVRAAEAQTDLFPGLSESPRDKALREYRTELEEEGKNKYFVGLCKKRDELYALENSMRGLLYG
jgi:plasmid replication initiation protein